MNIDFHYYGTYLAASYAGYNAKEAEIIAHAAQLVDDCTIHNLIQTDKFEQIVTSRDTVDIALEAADALTPYTESDVQKAKEIWSYFHFLPGNEDGRMQYNGRRKNNILEPRWRFDDKLFCYMCLPECKLAEQMINQTVQIAQSKQSGILEFVGLRMHVLADTWAHAYFAGLPEWCMNDVRQTQNIYEYDAGNWIKTEVGVQADSPAQHRYQVARVSSQRFISPVYLGHAQVGQMPDLGYLHFKYVPVWKENLADKNQRWVEKNNQDSYLKAFAQMVSAMKAIRNNSVYPQNVNMEVVDQQLQAEIAKVLATRKLDQSEEWKTLIQKQNGSIPDDYVKNSWQKECSQSDKQEDTHYAYFCEAASIQKQFLLARF